MAGSAGGESSLLLSSIVSLGRRDCGYQMAI